MIKPEEFRTGQHGIPLAQGEELPACCNGCKYLVYEEFTVCFVSDPFYYYCGYHWADRSAETVPPCLEQERPEG